MSFGGPFAEPHPLLRRVEALQTGKLTVNDITVLCQDIMERGEATSWGMNVYNLIGHQIECGLCTPTVKVNQ